MYSFKENLSLLESDLFVLRKHYEEGKEGKSIIKNLLEATESFSVVWYQATIESHSEKLQIKSQELRMDYLELKKKILNSIKDK